MPCKNCAVAIHYVSLGLKYCPWCGLEINPRCPDLSNLQPSLFADRICDSIIRNGGTEAGHDAEQPQQPLCEMPPLKEMMSRLGFKSDTSDSYGAKKMYRYLKRHFTKR